MRRAAMLTLVALLVVTFARISAVTDGRLDGNAHPAVVLLLMEVGGQPAFRCTGTLLSPTVLLTAGHCTNNFPGAPFTGMRVFTESDVEAGIGTTNNYPFPGPNSIEATFWTAHPLYETGPFFVHDVGVVLLQPPGFLLPASQYRTPPDSQPTRHVEDSPRPTGRHIHRRRVWPAGELPGSSDVPRHQHQDAVHGDSAAVANQRAGLHRRLLLAAVEQSQHWRDVFR